MPSSAPVPCREHGCAGLAYKKPSYCKDHLPGALRAIEARQKRARVKRDISYNEQRRNNPEEAKLSAFYGSPAWRRLRNAHITHNPLCYDCNSRGRLSAAAVVDHIIERRDGGKGLDPNNLMSLCASCHNYKTAMAKKARASTSN